MNNNQRWGDSNHWWQIVEIKTLPETQAPLKQSSCQPIVFVVSWGFFHNYMYKYLPLVTEGPAVQPPHLLVSLDPSLEVPGRPQQLLDFRLREALQRQEVPPLQGGSPGRSGTKTQLGWHQGIGAGRLERKFWCKVAGQWFNPWGGRRWCHGSNLGVVGKGVVLFLRI